MKLKTVIWEDKQKWINFQQTNRENKGEQTQFQINKTRNEKGEVTTDNTEIQRIIRHYYKQLCANKMDRPEEMDRFLGTAFQDWTKKK